MRILFGFVLVTHKMYVFAHILQTPNYNRTLPSPYHLFMYIHYTKTQYAHNLLPLLCSQAASLGVQCFQIKGYSSEFSCLAPDAAAKQVRDHLVWDKIAKSDQTLYCGVWL